MINTNTNKGKHSALNEINKISFAIDELRLYLDTHPCNRRALDLFNCYVKEREGLVCAYEAAYGPLFGYSMNNECGWQWTEAPMPWEGDC